MKKARKFRRFQGSLSQYSQLHLKWREEKGEPKCCSICGAKNVKYDLANKSQKYKDEIDDWMYLCKSCHRKYDSSGYKLKDDVWYKLCNTCGKFLNAENYFYKRKTMTSKNGKEYRQTPYSVWCKKCTYNVLHPEYSRV